MKSNSVNPTWQNFKQYKPLIYELVFRDLKLKYRRSVLGYLWSLLNPLLMMIIMTIVFSYMFKQDIENFPMYLICGNTLFTFFTESTTMAMNSIVANGSLIKKVYIPKYIFPMSRVFSSFVTMSFSLVAILLVMVFTRSPFHLTVLMFWIPLLLLLIFSMGIGLVLSSLSVYFQDVTHLYGVITMAWMYLTPLFYPLNANFIPEFVVNIIKANPLYYYIDIFRSVVIYGNVPEMSMWVIATGFSILSMLIGLLVIKKLQKKFVLYL